MDNKIDRLQSAYRRVEPVGIGRVRHDVARTDLLGGRTQLVLAPCDQHDVVTQLAQLAAASLSDPAAAAGD